MNKNEKLIETETITFGEMVDHLAVNIAIPTDHILTIEEVEILRKKYRRFNCNRDIIEDPVVAIDIKIIDNAGRNSNDTQGEKDIYDNNLNENDLLRALKPTIGRLSKDEKMPSHKEENDKLLTEKDIKEMEDVIETIRVEAKSLFGPERNSPF